MTPSFQRLMAHANRLTRGGQLMAATQAIRAALGHAAAAGAPSAERPIAGPGPQDDVIDVPARELNADTQADPDPGVKAHDGPDAGFTAGSFSHGGLTRAYKLFVPPGHAGQALPLVVMLHGCKQDPDDFAAGTAMNQAALRLGCLVLYPAQAQSANPSRCWNWFKHNHQQRGRGEPALLAAMVRDVAARCGADAQRVYVAGLSAGGAMAAILGDAYPDVFAAVGVHSGLPTGAASDVPSAFSAMQGGAAADRSAARGTAKASPPTIVFHGDQDSTVHPVNGEHVLAASTAGIASVQAGPVAAAERAHSANGREFTRRIHCRPDGRTQAEHWTVHGAGHAWSGGSAAGSYTDGRGPSATDEMLRFFLAHRLAAH